VPPAVELLTTGLHYCIRKAVHELSRIFPKQGVFAGFSLYIVINIAGRISEEAMGGEGRAKYPVLPVNEPKKTGVRTRGQNSLVINIVQVYMGWLYTIDALCRLSNNTYSESSTVQRPLGA
jgi:hypothetical protein